MEQIAKGEHRLRALEELRRTDRDRFLCAIAAPADLRLDLATLYAFNAELAGIADKVSEPMLGLIRLQWWRDALDDLAAGRPHRHHLVQDLADLVARRGLRLDLLRGLVDARERDVEATQPDDLAALEAYAGATAGVLAELALEICLADATEAWRVTARRIGTAYGLVGILRATPYLARNRRILLPARELVAAGVAREQLLEFKPGPQLQPVVRQVAARAGDMLAAARRERLPRRAVAALFPGRLAVAQLEQLRRHGYDPFAAGSAAPSGLNIWRLLAARGLGRI
ncbi:squalene/phytoene synthase family protein [Dongia sp.]|uniref:squalene/phytoene synthase family protein n=1 Tax=Dongia sp. TaxID=1977262 RepID=UPI0035B13ADD